MTKSEDVVEPELLLEAVEQQPDDAALRERAARALEAAGRPGDAVRVLTERLVNLTAHEGPPLPCLCRRCIEPDRTRCEDETGAGYYRGFAVARGRVLFFWIPEEVRHGDAVGASVAAVMSRRLKPSRRRAD